MASSVQTSCGLDLQKDYIGMAIYSADEHAASQINIRQISPSSPKDAWASWEEELKIIRSPLKHYATSVICSVPAEYAVVKVCSLDADEKNVGEVVEWELSQQIIGSIDQYSFDYQEIAGGGGPTKKYLVAGYRKEFVNRMAGVIRKIKLEPRIVDLDIFALINVFEANYKEKITEPSLLVHCERHLTKLVLTRNAGLLDYHCFEHATGFSDPAGYGVSLAAEINRFLSGSQQLAGGERAGIYMTGSYLRQAETRNAVFAEVKGSELLNPFRAITCQLQGIQEDQLLEHSTQLAVAVGLSLRSAG